MRAASPRGRKANVYMKKRVKKYGPAAVILLLCALGGAAAVIWRQELWAIITSQAARDEFIAWVQSKGVWGVLVFLGLEVFQIVVAFVPGEPVQLMAGALFGSIGGMLICLVGILLGSAFIYGLMKVLGARAIPADALHKYRFLQSEQKARSALYILFFLPGVPKDILTYLGPFLPLKMSEFLFTCTLARIPCLLATTVAGDSLADGELWLPILLFLVTGAIGLWCIRNEQRLLAWLHRRSGRLQPENNK